LNAANRPLKEGVDIAFNNPERPILGDALLGAFKRSLGEQDLSAVTARGYLHDLGRFRGWLESEPGTKPRDLRRLTAVDLINYRQRLLRTRA
jgi:hypothetical protein